MEIEPEAFEIERDGKFIQCERRGAAPPDLVFTHGAGGTLSTDAVANFAAGFSHSASIVAFQGNMNLKSRTKSFKAVMEHQGFSAHLGGRSMGARAAVMASSDDTIALILASYPLHTDKEVRDQLLYGIRPKVNVLFISGDHDSMCDLERLQQVRKQMRCRTSSIIVRDADHGMNVKPKKATNEIVRMTGTLGINHPASISHLN